MGKKYLIDTNILIYVSRNTIPESSNNFIKEVFNESFKISVITEIEYLGWNKLSSEDIDTATKFIDTSEIFPLSLEIKNLAIKLKQKYNIKLADAVIAATAIQQEFILVSRNQKDFEKIQELEVYNPFS
ncbi:MAG: hypothetical protein A2039_01660 [Candidatus Melainabacteria bacterium GWA2_34_9]|nr:MAG: hypothetical protein A2039_01660 [Candidatus Melainabacteria bacterium GWA2_34_9]